jgi:DNA-binding transcriptional MocR family regulator
MVIKLEKKSGNPLYKQISEHISRLISEGKLQPGSRLPDTRALSNSLGVSRNTVVYAYNELEARGLICSHVGRGTFVQRYLPPGFFRPSTVTLEKMSYDGLFSSSWDRFYSHSSLRGEDLWRIREGVGIISFASDLPDTRLFPFEEFRECMQAAMRTYGPELLTHGEPEGFSPLLDYLPTLLARRNIMCKSSEIMIVNGVQQALSIVGRLFLDPGDNVILENLTYPGALAVFQSLQANCLGIPVDEDGLRLETIESILKRRKVKLIYTIPTYQNPTGSVLSSEKKKRLIELCREHRIVVIEDDYAHELNLEGNEILPLKSWDESDCVIYMGSLSNLLFPGIRLSLITAPEHVIKKLAQIKQTSDLYTNRIVQAALLKFCQRGYLEKHLKKKRLQYRQRRDVMLALMQKHFPEETAWQKAMGGIFQWVDIQCDIDTNLLFSMAKERGVLFAPDSLFLVDEWKRKGMRLSFANEDEDKISEGISTLGNLLKEMIIKNH